VQQTDREADGEENHEGEHVCRLARAESMDRRYEKPPDEGGGRNRRDTIPPTAALTTIAAVIGSQNAPVEARTTLSATKPIDTGTSAIKASRSTRTTLGAVAGSRQPTESIRVVDPLSSASFGVIPPTAPRCAGARID